MYAYSNMLGAPPPCSPQEVVHPLHWEVVLVDGVLQVRDGLQQLQSVPELREGLHWPLEGGPHGLTLLHHRCQGGLGGRGSGGITD